MAPVLLEICCLASHNFWVHCKFFFPFKRQVVTSSVAVGRRCKQRTVSHKQRPKPSAYQLSSQCCRILLVDGRCWVPLLQPTAHRSSHSTPPVNALYSRLYPNICVSEVHTRTQPLCLEHSAFIASN